MQDFFQAEIRNITRYRQQIRKLFTKLKERRALFSTQQAGVNYFSFGLHEAKLAKLLCTAVVNESYEFQPAKQRVIVVNNKKRIVYDFVVLDKIVIGVVIGILTEIAETYLSNQVFSYRKGRRPLDAVKRFAGYLQKQRAKTEAQKNEGCYVLKTDIADYTDNIFLDQQSKLWVMLTEMLAKSNVQLTSYQQQLIRDCFRPSYINAEGLLQCNSKGVPTGSVASTLAYNLYVAEIDKQLTRIAGLYYSRYCDDILMAHSDPRVLNQAIDQFNQMLVELGLQRKQQKDVAVYFNKAGKSAEWRGSHKLTFLGYDVYANGTFMLSSKRQAKLLAAIRQRIKNVIQLCQMQSSNELGKIICQTVNSSLLDETFGENAVQYLLECTNLAMLKHLDYLIALSIAESVSQRKGVRAFRTVPYHKIRSEWDLASLVSLRVDLYRSRRAQNA